MCAIAYVCSLATEQLHACSLQMLAHYVRLIFIQEMHVIQNYKVSRKLSAWSYYAQVFHSSIAKSSKLFCLHIAHVQLAFTKVWELVCLQITHMQFTLFLHTCSIQYTVEKKNAPKLFATIDNI